jgi:uncharacterized protein
MTRRAGALAAACVALAAATAAAQSPPPVPRDFVTDEAGILSADAKARLEAALRRFDAETSNQVLVAIYPKLPSASLEDFTVRTAQAWRAGRGKLDNGVVLFVFVEDRKVRLEVGYGLEGALPDVTAHRIIDEQITPAFRNGDYAGGLEAGVAAIIAATRGEYTASPRPAAGGGGGLRIGVVEILVILFVLYLITRGGGGGGRRSRTYGRRGYRSGGIFPFPIVVGGGGWGGGGGGGGFGGGGFSGGGGSFGGGGASGSW